jgi:hypothetical protein
VLPADTGLEIPRPRTESFSARIAPWLAVGKVLLDLSLARKTSHARRLYPTAARRDVYLEEVRDRSSTLMKSLFFGAMPLLVFKWRFDYLAGTAPIRGRI